MDLNFFSLITGLGVYDFMDAVASADWGCTRVGTGFTCLLLAVLIHNCSLFFPFGDQSMLQKKKIDVDVIKDVLEAMLAAEPDSTFIKSLSHQYEERGGLSKKQLEGLYQKALKVESIPDGKLATMEAVIMKKPTRYKSAPSSTQTIVQ